MYGMKNIYSNTRSGSLEVTRGTQRSLPNILEQNSTSEVEDLKKRQEDILIQLNFLKEQMVLLREELVKGSLDKKCDEITNNLPTIKIEKNITVKTQWNGIPGEIVINASPERPPYSLLAVNRLWPDVLRLLVVCHTHSSVAHPPSHISCFSPLSLTARPNVCARLIWNTVGPDCELVISPVNYSPVKGEVNILRFLHRSINGLSDPITETRVDHILDVCHRLAHAHTQRDRQIYVRTLNALLGHASWLGGEKPSVVDVAGWSAIRNTPGIELSQNMTRWNDRCRQAFEVSAE